jgi:hypothetical protein
MHGRHQLMQFNNTPLKEHTDIGGVKGPSSATETDIRDVKGPSSTPDTGNESDKGSSQGKGSAKDPRPADYASSCIYAGKSAKSGRDNWED